MKAKKKQLGLAALLLLSTFFLYLGFSGASNVKTDQEDTPPKQKSGVIEVAGEEVKTSFFVSFRHEREVKHQQQRDILNELINNSNVSAETRKGAQSQLLELAQTSAKESEIENQILAKGFKDVVSTVSSSGVNLTVYGEKFSAAELTKLQEIAVRAAGVRLENVVVVPRQ